MNDYKIGSTWRYKSLLKLYMKYFHHDKITIDREHYGIKNGINNGTFELTTSFPIYQNMTKFLGDNNSLASFPIQPKMIEFSADNNELTSFPIQPEMKKFSAKNNQITTFPIQPKMKYFYKLRSFSIYETINPVF